MDGAAKWILLVLSTACASAGASPPQITFAREEYLSRAQPYFRGDARGENQSVKLEVDESRRWRRLTGHLEASDQYSQSEKWNYLNVYQVYGEWNLARGQSLSLGRKQETWTGWEERWGQGLFEPRYLEDRLHPRAAGLTGVFYQAGNENLNATLAAQPVFIPDFGPHFDLQNDRFSSANPWFHPPAAQFRFNGVESDIRYTLNPPSARDVIRHPGFAAKLEGRKGPYFARLSYAYQPLPQLLLGFPSRGRFRVQDGDTHMNVEINTRLLYHRVVNWDQSLRWGAWTASLSVANETPDSDPGPADWTSQQVRPAWIFSGAVSRPLEDDGPQAARVSVGFLNVNGGDAVDAGDFAGQQTLFERRYQYLEAVRVDVQKPWRFGAGRRLDSAAAAIYDRAQNGGVLELRSAYAWDRNWRAEVGLQLLGLLGGQAAVSDGFLTTYRANDRLTAGMSYVF